MQRGHQSMFETAIFYVPLSLAIGRKHPITIGLGGLCYTIGAYTYGSNYKLNGADNRNGGLAILKYVGLLTTLVTAIKISVATLK